MPDRTRSPTEAVVICTRNRPTELAETLRSVVAQEGATRRLVLIVDASDPENTNRTAQAITTIGDDLPIQHCLFRSPPSSARQRNAGIEQLPPSVDIVHFIDDDVTLRPGYFPALSTVLRTRPEVGGVGGLILEPDRSSGARRTAFLRRAFLLDHPDDGRVLPSGRTTSAQIASSAPSHTDLRSTEWLSGCSSYCRSLLETHRFDDALQGYSMMEDLDLSYRVGRETRLVVHPKAQLLHRRSQKNRFNAERYHRALTVHQRWFVEKHFDSTGARMAYWWSIVGRALALLTASAPTRMAALRGLCTGIARVWSRDHPLLSPSS
jgi:GT2 family glycosyltransferase